MPIIKAKTPSNPNFSGGAYGNLHSAAGGVLERFRAGVATETNVVLRTIPT